MTYMQSLEARLERLLSGIEEKDIIIREVKAIALESYRNGQQAGAPKTRKAGDRESGTRQALQALTAYHAEHIRTRPAPRRGAGFAASERPREAEPRKANLWREEGPPRPPPSPPAMEPLTPGGGKPEPHTGG